MVRKFLDANGLRYLWGKFREAAVPVTRRVNNKALGEDIILSASDVGAATMAQVMAAIEGKQNTLSFDSAPTAGSSNPVTSDGVFNALASAADGSASRAEVKSYVGTGACGENNPCSLTFSFAPKAVIWLGTIVTSGYTRTWQSPVLTTGSTIALCPDAISTEFVLYAGFHFGSGGTYYGKASADKKTIVWYDTQYRASQLNETKNEYWFVAIG